MLWDISNEIWTKRSFIFICTLSWYKNLPGFNPSKRFCCFFPFFHAPMIIDEYLVVRYMYLRLAKFGASITILHIEIWWWRWQVSIIMVACQKNTSGRYRGSCRNDNGGSKFRFKVDVTHEKKVSSRHTDRPELCTEPTGGYYYTFFFVNQPVPAIRRDVKTNCEKSFDRKEYKYWVKNFEDLEVWFVLTLERTWNALYLVEMIW